MKKAQQFQASHNVYKVLIQVFGERFRSLIRYRNLPLNLMIGVRFLIKKLYLVIKKKNIQI